MNQTSRDRDNNRRVRTHENNSGETVRRLGTIIQSIFVPNQEPASAWIFGHSSVRVGIQGLFCPYLKTFAPPFLPTRLTAPGSSRMRSDGKGRESETRALRSFPSSLSRTSRLSCVLASSPIPIYWLGKACRGGRGVPITHQDSFRKFPSTEEPLGYSRRNICHANSQALFTTTIS